MIMTLFTSIGLMKEFKLTLRRLRANDGEEVTVPQKPVIKVRKKSQEGFDPTYDPYTAAMEGDPKDVRIGTII